MIQVIVIYNNDDGEYYLCRSVVNFVRPDIR